jgi:hypothetical protein
MLYCKRNAVKGEMLVKVKPIREMETSDMAESVDDAQRLL